MKHESVRQLVIDHFRKQAFRTLKELKFPDEHGNIHTLSYADVAIELDNPDSFVTKKIFEIADDLDRLGRIIEAKDNL